MWPTSIKLDAVDVQRIMQREFDFSLVGLILTTSLIGAVTELFKYLLDAC
jgi:hypothetical protein